MKHIYGRGRGITYKYAATNIELYNDNDILKLIPEPNNPYDSNAVAIYDSFNHHIGYVAKEINMNVLNIIKNKDYICKITRVYFNYKTPSIEYRIDYYEQNEKKIKFSSNKTVNEMAQNKKNDMDINSIYHNALYLIDLGRYADAVILLENYEDCDSCDILFYLGYAYFGLGTEMSLYKAF